MTTSTLILRHLCFTGPNKPLALITFNSGLNVLYGASETGKSFVLEAIDFMLGGQGPLRDIPERVGYDRIFLGIDTADNGSFTIVRAPTGGQFQQYEGLHQCVPDGVEPKVLGAKHSATSDDNLSSYLLHKIGLNDKRVKTNARSETRNLSFRDLCHICLVSEVDIQKQGSPIESGQAVLKTAEYAIFKLLLTGIDDRTLVPVAQEEGLSQSRAAKIEFIDELIVSYQDKMSDIEYDQEELRVQLEKVEASIAQEQQALSVSEEQYQGVIDRRDDFRRRLQNGLERRGEIDEMLARFKLLDEHYSSDLARLEGIREAGLLIGVLSPQTCPLCGAEPGHQNHDSNCYGNLEAVVTAVDAEREKIVLLRRELKETVGQLEREAQSFDHLIPKIREDVRKLEEEIKTLGSWLKDRRTTYTELVEKRATVRAGLSAWEQLVDLQTRRKELEKASEGAGVHLREATDLSSTTLDQFAQQVEQLLKAWNFPDPERVYFDPIDRDLVIYGKRRSSRGKGMRAITHAAFTVALLEFCKSQNKPHPGFVILDSPLLAYREPEGEEDDLRGTDVQEKFYEYLSSWTNRQVIIIENIDPPLEIRDRSTSTFFSKNPHQGRYGFFPILTR